MSTLEKLIKYLEPIAEKEQVEKQIYWVTESILGEKISDENMTEHGLLEDYCSKCIDRAVEQRQKEWTVERNVLMGQIYEAQQSGFYTFFGYSNTGNSKYFFRKSKVSHGEIDVMKKKLKRSFRIGHKFSSISSIDTGERNGFCYCNSCGAMFDSTLLLDNQELEHWEQLDDKHYATIDSRSAYQLLQILEYGRYDSHELYDRVVELAKRIWLITSNTNTTTQSRI